MSEPLPGKFSARDEKWAAYDAAKAEYLAVERVYLRAKIKMQNAFDEAFAPPAPEVLSIVPKTFLKKVESVLTNEPSSGQVIFNRLRQRFPGERILLQSVNTALWHISKNGGCERSGSAYRYQYRRAA